MSAARAGLVPARLVWIRPNEGELAYELRPQPMLVGRDEDADIRLDEPLVSRAHARIESRGDGYVVLDLGSTNLTKVNGTVVTECVLRDGDEVRFGRARCRFELIKPSVATEPA
jgi:pSer/pThr/pTyr-binding forkhead associated (FHA) protein